MSNPFSKKDLQCLPPYLLGVVANLEFLTYNNVAEIPYEESKNFDQDLDIMRAAVRRQEASVESVLESIKRSSTKV